MISVDAFDLKMLAALQDDGRLTNQQLADLVGLSASQCSRRRMRLEEEKVIAGYHADLAGEALGFNLIAFIHITLATHSPDNAKKFRALVNRVDAIQEARDELAEALGFRATVFSTLGRTDRTHRQRYRLTLPDHRRRARGRGHEQGRRDGERDR